MNLEMNYEMRMLPPQSCREGNINLFIVTYYGTLHMYEYIQPLQTII